MNSPLPRIIPLTSDITFNFLKMRLNFISVVGIKKKCLFGSKNSNRVVFKVIFKTNILWLKKLVKEPLLKCLKLREKLIKLNLRSKFLINKWFKEIKTEKNIWKPLWKRFWLCAPYKIQWWFIFMKFSKMKIIYTWLWNISKAQNYSNNWSNLVHTKRKKLVKFSNNYFKVFPI